MTRLPILRLLAAGEKSIGGEILGQPSKDVKRRQKMSGDVRCHKHLHHALPCLEVTGIGSGIWDRGVIVG